jgi:pyridoxamine 5'-phosphate oxidase-like protein
MNRDELMAVMRSNRYAIEATVTQTGAPQAAVIGIAVTDAFEIVFDTLGGSRKAQNLRVNRRVALVLGNSYNGDERTIQYEGLADEPTGAELQRLKDIYFGVFPDGRERQKWPGMTYFRVMPVWLRYSNYNMNPPEILEFDAGDLTSA